MSHFFLITTLEEFKNRPTFAKVTVKIKVAQFFLTHSVHPSVCPQSCSDLIKIWYVGYRLWQIEFYLLRGVDRQAHTGLTFL